MGNELAITEATFHKALQRAKEVDSCSEKGEQSTYHTWFSAMRRDVSRTLPEVGLFHPGAPLHNDLTDILMAYSMYRSDVGYSHGTHVSLIRPSPGKESYLTLSTSPSASAFTTHSSY